MLKKSVKIIIFINYFISILLVTYNYSYADTMVINFPPRYSLWQRDNDTSGIIPIYGTYVGSPTAIEASFNGGPYEVFDTAPSGNTYKGELKGSVGSGKLNVRFKNDISINNSIEDISIGDLFVVAGQSNAEGYGDSYYTFNRSYGLFASVYREDGAWKPCDDPTSSGTYAKGSPYPKIANFIMQSQKIPVGFITTATGSTSITDWIKDGELKRYNNMIAQIQRATNNTMKVKALLFYQGENDQADTSMTSARYKSYVLSMAAGFINETEIASTILMGQVNNQPSGKRAQCDVIRKAQQDLWSESVCISKGPVTYDIFLSQDNIHFKTDTEITKFSERWWAAIAESIYSIDAGTYPVVDGILLNNTGENTSTITLTFNRTRLPLIIADYKGVTGNKAEGWRINDGTNVYEDSSIKSTIIDNNSIILTVNANLSANAKISYGSYLDAYDKKTLRSSGPFNLPVQLIFEQSMFVQDNDITERGSQLDNKKGDLIIKTMPYDVEIYINGVYKGNSDKDGLKIAGLMAGEYVISAKREMYQILTVKQKVLDKETKEIKMELALKQGKIRFSSTPNKADIYIDGVKRGITSLTLEDINAGIHEIKLSKAGYEDYMDVKVEPEQLYTINKALIITNIDNEVKQKAKRTTDKNYIEPEMVLIDPGEYLMGDCCNEGFKDECPSHAVYITAFYMGIYEITFDEYDAFCDATGKPRPPDEGWGRGKLPVINVTCNDAVEYCKWLSNITGENYRLPTEAEWEKAARGGAESKRYPLGNYIDNAQANYNSSKTKEVGSYPANGYGLFDMAGNVCEWCQDWYNINFYNSSPSYNPTNYLPGTYRVYRGGSWNYNEYYLRCAIRYNNNPLYKHCAIGFRVAKNLRKSDGVYGSNVITDTIVLYYPPRYSLWQRDSDTTGTIQIYGNYTGNPTAIEASFNGGPYEVIDTAPSGNYFKGELHGLVGSGRLNVRFKNEGSINNSIEDISIGDLFVVAGQSNAEGYGEIKSTFTRSNGLLATVYRENDAWKLCDDPTSSGKNAKGSPYPKIADFIIQSQKIPVGFITTALGGTSSIDWKKGGERYNNMASQIKKATNDTMKVKALLFYQGEADIVEKAISYDNYKSNILSMVEGFIKETGNTPNVLIGQINKQASGTRERNDDIRKAQQDLWIEYPYISRGPITYDIFLSADDAHYITDTEINEFSERWWAAIAESVYKVDTVVYPVVEKIILKNPIINTSTITLSFKKTGFPLEIADCNGISGKFAEGWRIKDGTTVYDDSSIKSTVIDNNSIILTVDASLSANAKISYGSYLDAYNKKTLRSSGPFNLPVQLIFGQSVSAYKE